MAGGGRRAKRRMNHDRPTFPEGGAHVPLALTKHLRPPSPDLLPAAVNGTSTTVVVTGIPSGCTVMALKTRLEIYGPVARAKVDAASAAATVSFRWAAAADVAIHLWIPAYLCSSPHK